MKLISDTYLKQSIKNIENKFPYTNSHWALISNKGTSETLLNLALPPLIASSVSLICSFLIGPSCSVNLFLLPAFNITTLSVPEYPNSSPHFFSMAAFIHINLKWIPLSSLVSNLAFNCSNWSFTYFDGFWLVNRMTQRTPSLPRQMSLALLSYISGNDSVIHSFVADESRELPPPGTKTSE